MALTETCKECGLVGTHRGTCSRSMMRSGQPGFLGIQSQAVMGDRVIDMHTGEAVKLIPFPTPAKIHEIRRDLLLEARTSRARADIYGVAAERRYARGLRVAARRLREVLR